MVPREQSLDGRGPSTAGCLNPGREAAQGREHRRPGTRAGLGVGPPCAPLRYYRGVRSGHCARSFRRTQLRGHAPSSPQAASLGRAAGTLHAVLSGQLYDGGGSFLPRGLACSGTPRKLGRGLTPHYYRTCPPPCGKQTRPLIRPLSFGGRGFVHVAGRATLSVTVCVCVVGWRGRVLFSGR